MPKEKNNIPGFPLEFIPHLMRGGNDENEGEGLFTKPSILSVELLTLIW